jgi:hypothetical protein
MCRNDKERIHGDCTATKIPFMYSSSGIGRRLSPNFHIHVSVSGLYIIQDLSTYLATEK